MSALASSSGLQKRPDWVSGSLAALHCVVVFGPLYVAVASHTVWVWALAYLWFGVTIHGLLHLMHESAHYHTFRRRQWSDHIANWILGPLVFADFEAYRRRHWDHHRYLGESGDTKFAYRTCLSGWGLPRLLWRCLTLREGMSKLQLQVPDENGSMSRGVVFRTLLVQVCFFGSLLLCAWLSGTASRAGLLQRCVVVYAIVYVYGLASLSPFVSTLRTVAEHQPGPDDAPRVGGAALRNFRCGPIMWLVFGAYGFSHHATHHREPAVPSYRLAAVAQRSDAATGLGHPRGYLSTLAMLVRGSTRDSGAESLA